MDQCQKPDAPLDIIQFDTEAATPKARTLSPDQGQALLTRLARDDAFRAIYAADPATALLSMGVSAEAIEMLDRKCLREQQLADKAVFAALLGDVQSRATSVAMSMEIPRLSFV
jgi:putative modified peptide